MDGYPVYLLGSRFEHHARHSGYEGFSRYLGTPSKAPVSFRYIPGYWGWRIDHAVGSLARRPYYTAAALLTEISISSRMITKRDVLYHAIYGDTDLWMLPRVSRWTRNRLVATFHEPASTLEIMAVDSRIVADLAGVILVAEGQRVYFENLIDPERIVVVPHGVDTEFFRPPAQCTSRPVCITVGSHLRDFSTLKRAMEMIWEVKPATEFIAVGLRHSNDSPARFVFPPNDTRIQFFERISDEELKQKYQTASVALFSFQDATVNNAMLESMACGLPVVATDVGGIREYLSDNAGILCPPKDPSALANGVCKVFDDLPLAREMSEASRARAVQFSYPVIAAKMSQVYSDVLEIIPR